MRYHHTSENYFNPFDTDLILRKFIRRLLVTKKNKLYVSLFLVTH